MASISMDRGGSDSEQGELDDSSLSLSQYIPDKKRKSSPLTDNPMKKQNSLLDISKLTAKDKRKLPPKTFSDNLKMTLNDSTFSKVSPQFCLI